MLELEGIHCRYGRRVVLDGVSAGTLASGSVAALIGPNGAGKSTLFRRIAGLHPDQGGRILLEGAALERMAPRQRSRLVFHLAQDQAVGATLSVFEIVLLARKAQAGAGLFTSAADRAAVEAVLDELDLAVLAAEPIDTLSGGQRQLVGIACALVREPRILLLDEPTSALDLRRQLEVMSVVRRIAASRGLVVLAAMHDLGLAARFADRLLLLSGGRIEADGPPGSVLADPAVGRTYRVAIHLSRSARGTVLVEPELA